MSRKPHGGDIGSRRDGSATPSIEYIPSLQRARAIRDLSRTPQMIVCEEARDAGELFAQSKSTASDGQPVGRAFLANRRSARKNIDLTLWVTPFSFSTSRTRRYKSSYVNSLRCVPTVTARS